MGSVSHALQFRLLTVTCAPYIPLPNRHVLHGYSIYVGVPDLQTVSQAFGIRRYYVLGSANWGAHQCGDLILTNIVLELAGDSLDCWDNNALEGLRNCTVVSDYYGMLQEPPRATATTSGIPRAFSVLILTTSSQSSSRAVVQVQYDNFPYSNSMQLTIHCSTCLFSSRIWCNG